MATNMIVIKTAAYGGGQTSAMPQATAQTYLGGLIGKGSPRLTNLSQALNQAFNDQGKACGTLTYNGSAPRHASAGVIGVSSVTLFYTRLARRCTASPWASTKDRTATRSAISARRPALSSTTRRSSCRPAPTLGSPLIGIAQHRVPNQRLSAFGPLTKRSPRA